MGAEGRCEARAGLVGKRTAKLHRRREVQALTLAYRFPREMAIKSYGFGAPGAALGVSIGP